MTETKYEDVETKPVINAQVAKGDSPDQEIDEAPTVNKDEVLVDRCSPDQSQLQQTVKIVKELQNSSKMASCFTVTHDRYQNQYSYQSSANSTR